ncbi:MAG: hypothetical protein EZS28_034532 [Streblomastix strix]|uniref:Uncharacterized protein n=1 Tax=Streblomastix strix TaxID=222440 RepID=A0A5J4UIS2_9EUKA|nr:MAG: hypothetical protein EZS28_034532 [Streblomastix strix]
MEKKQKYVHKSYLIDPKQVAKVPQILHDIGELQTVQGRLTRSQYKKIIDKIKKEDSTITEEEIDAAIEGYKGSVRQQRQYGGYDPNDLIENNKETNKDLEYIGGLDWGQKPVHPWYGKYSNEPHKVVDYKVTDQGALTARQRKILLSKEDRLNLDRPKTHKVAASRIISAIKAQEQLKNKLGRKPRKK